MDIDPIKAPRTYAAWKKAYDVVELAKFMVELSQQLEVELNTAIVNEAFAENKVHMLEKQLKEAQDRIKRLEEALTTIELAMKQPASNHRFMQIAGPARHVINIIKKAKEAKL